MPTNVLVFIHGITPERQPQSQRPLYRQFLAGMREREPQLQIPDERVCHVEWGNAIGEPVDDPRPDTNLSSAEQRVSDLVRYDRVCQHPGPNNEVHPGLFGDPSWLVLARPLLVQIRQQLVQFGLADAVYYTSEEGERDVRIAVYGQVLECLRPLREEPDVRLHVVAHSLGVTIAHDFLYGLFGKSTRPDFLEQARSAQDREDYQHWCDKRHAGQLHVGSFVSMASQLPIFALRKRDLVRDLARGETLDAAVIGIAPQGPVRWLVCYDIDDVLGFATRELYGNAPAIKQVQVDVGDTPLGAHVGYWTSDHMIREAAALIAGNAR